MYHNKSPPGIVLNNAMILGTVDNEGVAHSICVFFYIDVDYL
jgi:hypothetical protein